ncbi:TPA: zinc-ribbon domain-containing protein [Candidatus Woesearchaeota archaeon]|nr:zinc-ribbon domain-containing protein [Candidatus Woesearchaeota archaeon]
MVGEANPKMALKECPVCGSDVDERSQYCPECGNDFDPDAMADY